MIYLKMIRHWTVWPKADDWSAVSRSLLGLKKLNRLHLTFDRFKTLASFPFQKRQSASLTAPHPLPRILTFFSLVLCLRKLKGVRRNGSRSTTPSYPPYRHTIRYPLVRGRSVRDSGVLGIQYSDLASTTAVITSQKKRKKKKNYQCRAFNRKRKLNCAVWSCCRPSPSFFFFFGGGGLQTQTYLLLMTLTSAESVSTHRPPFKLFENNNKKKTSAILYRSCRIRGGNVLSITLCFHC